MKKLIPRIIFIGLGLLLLGGCQPDVIVKDEKGKPISGASVAPISLSINYKKVITDKKGHASIDFKVQEVKWVTVSKEGYISSENILYERKKPIVILLKKK